MPPPNKAGPSGVSSMAFLKLKAVVTEEGDDSKRKRVNGKLQPIIGGVERPEKKKPKWMISNAGVQGRAARDLQEDETTRKKLKSGIEKLEEKVKMYEQARRGKVTDEQLETYLVDFAEKGFAYSSDSDGNDDDEAAEDDDPIISYTDEFGRERTGRRSEIPLHLLPSAQEEMKDDPDVLRNPVNHWPMHWKDAEAAAAIEEEFADEPLDKFHNSATDNREKGPAQYTLDQDRERRLKQQQELAQIREETQRQRAEYQAVTPRPGEIQGMQGTLPAQSRAQEKRKREMEERRQRLLDKRRKTGGGEIRDVQVASPSPVQKTAGSSSLNADPSATLDAQSTVTTTHPPREEKVTSKPPNPADDFLAKLEQDMERQRR